LVRDAALLTAREPLQAPMQGIVLILFAVVFTAVISVLFKGLTADYPVVQTVWARYFFHLIPILILFPRRIPSLLASERKDLQLARSGLMLALTVITVIALRYMPVAEMVALNFVAPLLVTALSVVMLRETVGVHRWLSVAVGFIGVLIIIRPGFGGLGWAALLPIASALCYALYQVLTRMVRLASDPLVALFYTAILGTLATSAVVPFYWVEPNLKGWGMMVGVGMTAMIGHFLLIKAFACAPASTVTPFTYTELIWATIFAFAVFDDFPDLWTLVGAGVIAGSGLYILHRERMKRDPP
jgi:drug/metabolite transporter (DMT)-like permease